MSCLSRRISTRVCATTRASSPRKKRFWRHWREHTRTSPIRRLKAGDRLATGRGVSAGLRWRLVAGTDEDGVRGGAGELLFNLGGHLAGDVPVSRHRVKCAGRSPQVVEQVIREDTLGSILPF